jgi:hypothetical protein
MRRESKPSLAGDLRTRFAYQLWRCLTIEVLVAGARRARATNNEDGGLFCLSVLLISPIGGIVPLWVLWIAFGRGPGRRLLELEAGAAGTLTADRLGYADQGPRRTRSAVWRRRLR